MLEGKNGKWQLAFWVVTVICGIWLVGLSDHVVKNDRIRSSEDQRIEDKFESKFTVFMSGQTTIIEDLGKIKGRLDID